ncbi:hypothetical protein BST81_19950 [Leptolyngbya sp. 'hensonii']|uniref:phosphotransacetylase family protein n=1 Tax=Leptolyngbya sp. 'hensonii' TaxID=1922337 RepID=UPI00094F7F2B|nr:phosphotransacetylase family protein [Leptolyngbya sp. 'hensonii']OLP16711.1 hypothetical protein BST81_19950 [Leptolyngbya sp. 'hensonii']
MPKSTKYLLIGSTEPYCGKSATVLGLAHQLRQKGLDIGYGKPIGTYLSETQSEPLDEDVRFFIETLELAEDRVAPTLLALSEQTIRKRLQGLDQTDYQASLAQYLERQTSDLMLLEGPGSLAEGSLFDLSLDQVARVVDAMVLLVARYSTPDMIDALLAAKKLLGNRLLGALINDIPEDQLSEVQDVVKPFLERQGIAILGMLPRNDLLRSVSVRELAHQLQAKVLCRSDRLDLMVESLTIGAMNVSSALKYFQQGNNMAVVTGGDRTDIQLAALETSTQCMILTGSMMPNPTVLSRAEDLEIPILSVDLDTLTTVEIIDRAFGQVRLHEPVKVQCVRQLMSEHFDLDQMIAQMGLQPAISLP